ncbi:MAG: hypothetical protein AB1625_05870 [Acidobacteriota bacterium]
MSRKQFLLSNVIDVVLVGLWLCALYWVASSPSLSWVAKGVLGILLIFVTPTLDGHWRYHAYVEWWTKTLGTPGEGANQSAPPSEGCR